MNTDGGFPAPKKGAGRGLKAAVVASGWHPKLMDGLIAGALKELDRLGVHHRLVRVAGSFELPLACQKLLLKKSFEAAVALGVILRGSTPHFEYVAQATTLGLAKVSLKTGKPVGFGVLIVNDYHQGQDRAGLADSKEDRGGEAAAAAIMQAVLN